MEHQRTKQTTATRNLFTHYDSILTVISTIPVEDFKVYQNDIGYREP